MAFEQTNPVNICTTLNVQITIVNNLKYLGSWINSLKDSECKALASKTCNKIKKLWKSNLAKTLKIKISNVTIETILLYGSETLTINKSLGKK